VTGRWTTTRPRPSRSATGERPVRHRRAPAGRAGGLAIVADPVSEDANAEEDLVLGGYADRLIVELAQNASDAAARAGVSGELRLRLTGRVLSAANTGAPLDAEGVDGLTSLRASGKRDEQSSTGRFGIGFAATLAVSDEPEIRSTTGGIRFSLPDTDKAVRELGGPAAAELDRRDGRAAVLRLAWPAAQPPATAMPPKSASRCATTQRSPPCRPHSKASNRASCWRCPDCPQ